MSTATMFPEPPPLALLCWCAIRLPLIERFAASFTLNPPPCDFPPPSWAPAGPVPRPGPPRPPPPPLPAAPAPAGFPPHFGAPEAPVPGPGPARRPPRHAGIAQLELDGERHRDR